MSLADNSRPVALGEYMVAHNATVRKTAQQFSISKSTVHKDIRTKLPELSPELYEKVEKLLEVNKQERHIRGGLATKRKYEIQRKSREV